MTSASLRLTDIAFSAVWTQPVPEAFAGTKGDLAMFSQGPLFRAAVDTGLRRDPSVPHDVDLPWPRVTGQGFWAPYLGRRSVEGLSGADAWARLLPVRAKLGDVELGDTPGRLYLELFVSPGGVAVVASYRVREELTLDAAVTTLAAIRSGVDLELKFLGSGLSGRLADVAQRVIERVARDRVGVWPLGASGAPDPFTVCTVISARDLGRSPKVVAGGPLARAINAMAAWSPTWKRDPLPNLADVAITRSTRPASHLVYVRDRGRVVWFPQLFGFASRTRHSLSCYHRNQTLLALMLDIAADLLRAGEAELAAGKRLIDLPAGYRQSLQHAGQIVQAAVAGSQDIYRSRSAPRQLAANGGVAAYAALASQLGLPALP